MAHNDFQKHEQTPQELQNRSFDPTFDVAASEILGYDDGNNVLRRIAVDADGKLEITTAGGGGGLTDEELRASPVPVSASIDTTGLALETKQDALITELQLKADLTETQPVSAASLPLPSGAAISANQQTDALTDTELRASDISVETNLGQEESSVHAPGDIGVATWGVISTAPEIAEAGIADGDYAHMSLTKWHEMRTRDQRALSLQDCNDKTTVTVLSNDTINLDDSVNHVFGTGSLSFDKANGADDTVYAGIQDTIASIDISEIFEDGAYAAMGMLIPDITDVKKVFLRIGTDSSNYNKFEWGVSILKAGSWMSLRKPLSVPTGYAGNGWDTNAITYLAFGVEFNDEADTLVGIIVDNVHIIGGRVTDTTPNTTIVAAGATESINLTRVDSNPVDVDTGNSDTGTQRVVLASDQPTVDVDGSGVTQPVSIATMPSTPVTGTFWQTTQPVSGTFWQTTQPISVAALPLPTGASTSAKQLADNHNVTVSNPTADPETGLATSAKQLADGHNVAINAALPAGTNNIGDVDVLTLPVVKINPISWVAEEDSSVDASAVQIFDASTTANVVKIIVTNCGESNLFIGFDSGLTYLDFTKCLVPNDDWTIEIGTGATTVNDMWGIRAAAVTDDNVKVTKFIES